MNTMESYVAKRAKEIKEKRDALARGDYSEKDYMALFNRYSGQIDILYECLTAHDNTYNIKKEDAANN